MIGRRGVSGAVVLLTALLAAGTANALDISLGLDRSETTVGQQFSVEVTLRHNGMGRLPDATLPPVEGLRQVNRYTSQNFQFVNGRATSSVKISYVYVADAEGEFTIGPARVEKDGEIYESEPVVMKVVPAGSSASVRRLGEEDAAAAEGDDLIVLGQVDDANPYVNEQITYTFTFLHRARVLEGGRYTAPSFQGFWTEELDKTEPRQVVIDGRRYTAERIRTALFPTGPGEYVIGEAFVNTMVEDRRRRRRDPFDVFGSDRFGLFRSGREVVLRTDPIRVNVRTLPTLGKPDDFTGAVGQFELTAEVDRSELDAGEPVTLTVTLSGTGNVKVVPDPDLGELDGFKVYESQSSEKNGRNEDRIIGEKIWEFVLVPTSGGDIEIPALSMSVFDPEAERYVRLATKAIPLEVEATDLAEALALGGDIQLAKERVRLRQRDIRWVKPADGPLRRSGSSPFTRPIFLLAHAVPVLAFAGSSVYRKHKNRLRSDVEWARSRGAARAAKERLKSASTALAASDLEAFFGALSSGLRGYVADKLSLAAASLEEDAVRVGLSQHRVSEEDSAEFFSLLASCDGARFSPLGSDATAAAALLERARKWITGVDL